MGIKYTQKDYTIMARPRLDRTYEEHIKDRARQLKQLPANTRKSDVELRLMAEQDIKLNKLLCDLEISEQFEDTDEKMYAEELARKYFNDYTFEFVSDKNTLKQLIFLEMLNKRLQKSLNDFYKDAQSVPVQMMDGLHKNLMQIIELKKILGLTKADKENSNGDALNALNLLKKKFKLWRSQNQASRTLLCPHCSKMVMLKMRADIWESQKHPFFQDRLLANKHLITMFKNDKISKEDVAKVLETSPDYVDWMLKKLEPNRLIKDIQTTTTTTAGDVITSTVPHMDPNVVSIPSVFQVDEKMEAKIKALAEKKELDKAQKM